jgi:hypothetical protein
MTIANRLSGRGMAQRARRAWVTFTGGLTVIVGAILIPLPGPGTLIVLGGLSVLGREFPKARAAADRGRSIVDAVLGQLPGKRSKGTR